MALLDLRRLLAHNHSITLYAFGGEVQLCARCSGTMLGCISSKIVLGTPFFMNASLPFSIGFLVSLLLCLPMIVDWTTQSWGVRQSNNSFRLTTGFLEGVGLVVLNLTNVQLVAKFFILTVFGLAILSVGIFGRALLRQKMLRSQHLNARG